MVVFIDFLRALATCLITNTHYTGVYPIEALANGGGTGNALFFLISGYCLYNIRESFPKWYARRLHRLYVPTWIITGVYLLLGTYSLTQRSLFAWLVYPTGYHFIASIILLYAVYYLLVRPQWLRQRIGLVMAAVALFFGIWYLFFFDRTFYHITDVWSLPMRLLFLECMLLGAWFRQKKTHVPFRWWYLAGAVLFSGLDIIGRHLLSSRATLYPAQCIALPVLFAQVYCIFHLFAGLNSRLEQLPKAILRSVGFLATITLEIYVVQSPIITFLAPKLGFPLNWFALTGSILLAAAVLHLISSTLPKYLRSRLHKQ